MYLVTYDTGIRTLVVAPESDFDLNAETTALVEGNGFTWRSDIEAFTRPGEQDLKQIASTTLQLLQLGHTVIAAQGHQYKPTKRTERAAAAPDASTDPERSERQAAEAMTRHLVALGVSAETVNTGSNCWATSITLTPTTHLELADAPGELWSWCLYQHGGDQVLCGHWDSADDHTVASKTQALIHAMGSIA
ncbi:hypothetical protein [Streptomyces sp. NBC_01022]|uniref:hypothetical protein n=1 Tax=Streptomyces sp. NBC_01022 TaxID=2903723 RepID=UPI002DDAC698|nr:hypothetical protein [Streptomyces sp. NBC_01022]WRZ82607.1 hypothetical protein OG316_21280 [Streptomyces sp. NBC_01022]